MRTCKVENCKQKHYAKGYCLNHYVAWKRYGNPLFRKYKYLNLECKVKKCNKRYYAKEYCRKHHANFLRTGSPYGKPLIFEKCKVWGCKRNALGIYCGFHNKRLRSGLPLDNKIYSAKGKRNAMWKGGVAEYPNHYLMKKQRLIILMQNPKCEVCGKPATEIHHRNKNKADHRLKNLMASCHKCNCSFHRERPNSKYRKLYGMTLSEMAKKYNVADTTIRNRILENLPLDLIRQRGRPKIEA